MLSPALFKITKGKDSPYNIVLNEDGKIVSSAGVTRCDLNFKQNGQTLGQVISSSVDPTWFVLEHPVVYEGIATKAVRVNLKDTTILPGRYTVDVYVFDAVSTAGRFAGTLQVEIEGPLSAPLGALPSDLFGNLRLDVLTPAQIIADQNNYNPGTQGWWRLSSDAQRSLTGMAYLADNVFRIITNIGSFPIVIKHENSASVAANRFITRSGADLIVEPSQSSSMFVYDPVSDRWRELESKLPPFYRRIQAETNLGVTPTDSSLKAGYVRRYGAIGDGTTDDRAAIVVADSLGIPLIFDEARDYAILSNVTITNPVIIEPGARLKPALGVTVILNGGLLCSLNDWSEKRTGDGDLTIGIAQEVNADWWLAPSTTLASPNNTVQRAISGTARGSTIRFKGQYVSTPIDLIFDQNNQATATNRDAGKSLLGIGRGLPMRFGTQSVALGAEIILGNSQNDDLMSFTGQRVGTVGSRCELFTDGVALNGNKANNASGRCLYFDSVIDIFGNLFAKSAAGVGIEWDPNTAKSSNVCNFGLIITVDHGSDGIRQGGLGDPQWGTLHTGGNGGDGAVVTNGLMLNQVHSYVNGEHGFVFSGNSRVGHIRVNDNDDGNVLFASTSEGAMVDSITSSNAALSPASDPVDAHVVFGSTCVGAYVGKLHCKDNVVSHSGTHTGTANAAVLTDSAANFGAVDSKVGRTVTNTTDGSSGIITANTATTITATLSGGTDNDWDTGDAYTVTAPAKRWVSFSNGATRNRVAYLSGEGTPTGQKVFYAPGAADDGNIANPEKPMATVAYAAAVIPDPYAGRTLFFGELTGAISLTNFAVDLLPDGFEITTYFDADATNRAITWNARWNHPDGATTTVLANTERLMKWVAKGNIFQLASDQVL